MSILPSDILYNHLKKRGLMLSDVTKIQIPSLPQPQQSLLGKIGSYLSKKQTQISQEDLQVIPIVNSAFLTIIKNSLIFYKYKIDEETYALVVDQPQIIQLKNIIVKVSVCPAKYFTDRTEVPVIIQLETGLAFYIYDSKEMILKEKNFLKLGVMQGIGFVSEKEFICVEGKSNTHQFVIEAAQLKKKDLEKTPLLVNHDQKISKMWIFGNAEDQQDSTITIFYAVSKIKDNSKKFNLKVREYIRNVDGVMLLPEKADFQVPSSQLEDHSRFLMEPVGDYFCIQMPKQVLILKKKFGKYMFVDNMMEKLNGFDIFMCPMGIIASVGQKQTQINCVQFGDPKCTSRICDIIEFENEEISRNYKNFKQIWPILVMKEFSLIFVFLKGKQIILSHLLKRDPMEKMLNLVAKSSRNQLPVLRDMAANLGVSRKDFYLKLWSKSEKKTPDIYQFLIPCQDIPSIKAEIRNVLRKIKIQVSQILKIMERTTQIIERNLLTDLSYNNLKELVKIDFFKRKCKMNSLDKELDHRAFDKIYNDSLLSVFCDIVNMEMFPADPIIDPMYAMVDQNPDPELKTLENVFQEFKVILLEDYKDFLIEFLNEYPKNIVDIIKKYSFLLPNFPFKVQVQKPSKINEPILNLNTDNTAQPQWFQVVTLSQWKYEMTKEKIMKMLHYQYQTSKLNESIDQFVQSKYGENEKRKKHGLISVSLDNFIEKVEQLNDINLYLDICQFANELSIKNGGDPKVSKRILEVLQKQNKLKGQKLQQCKLFTSMHYFLLKNQIGTQKKLRITELKNLRQENLIALFFLENKQRKQFIFRDFMRLYEDKKKFKSLLEKFVASENCSRIQLQILMKQVIDMGYNFQRQNQQIIELLVMGLCKKLQIRQSLLILDTDQTQDYHAHSLIDEIEVSKDLALTINRIKQLKKCREIFKNFKSQKITYEELISLQKNNEIFKMLLQKYFNEDFFEKHIYIEGERISLDSPRSMLTLLIYLQQTVYYTISTFDLLITYGLILINWKQFDLIGELIYEEQVLKTLQVSQEEFVQTLIQRALSTIYYDQDIVYDEETRNQIICILNIDREKSPITIREMAKLRLAAIFEGFDCMVHPSDIETICHEWKNLNRNVFIDDLIQRYISKLSLEVFRAIYEQLQIADQQKQHVQIINSQYVDYCIIYSKKLLQEGRFQQTIEVLTFLKSIEGVKIDFGLLSQAFLKTLNTIHPTSLQSGKTLIDFFVQNNNPELDYNIKNLFENYFDETTLSLWQRQELIEIHTSYFYKQAKGKCFISLSDVWKMVVAECKESSDIYYAYYFMSVGLTKPEISFSRIRGISYNLEHLCNIILIRLEILIRQTKQLWIIDYDFLLGKFMEGLVGQAVPRLEMNSQTVVKNKLDSVLDMLKDNREANAQLIKCLKRVKEEIKSKMKKEERKRRFLNFLDQLQREEQRRKSMEAEPIQTAPADIVASQPFLTWKKVQEEKRNITSKSQLFMSQRDVIDQIFENFDDFEENKRPAEQKPNIFKNLFLPHIKIGADAEIIQSYLLDHEYEEVLQYGIDQVLGSIKTLQEQSRISIVEVIDILDVLKVGDINKKQIAKVGQIFKGNLSDQILNKLLPVDFFITPLQGEQEDKYRSLYEELRPQIKQIIGSRNSQRIKDLAQMLGGMLESVQFSTWVFYDALVYVGENLQFISDSALLCQQFFVGLNEYPEIIASNYQKLLDGFKDKEMRNYVRENLARIMEKKSYTDVVGAIRTY